MSDDPLDAALRLAPRYGYAPAIAHVYGRAPVAAAARTVLDLLDVLAARNDEPTEAPRSLCNCLVRWGRREDVAHELKTASRRVRAWGYGGAGKGGSLVGRDISKEPTTEAVYHACNALGRLRAEAGDRGRIHVERLIDEVEVLAWSHERLTGEPAGYATGWARVRFAAHLVDEWEREAVALQMTNGAAP